jgi:hypothetical protein
VWDGKQAKYEMGNKQASKSSLVSTVTAMHPCFADSRLACVPPTAACHSCTCADAAHCRMPGGGSQRRRMAREERWRLLYRGRGRDGEEDRRGMCMCCCCCLSKGRERSMHVLPLPAPLLFNFLGWVMVPPASKNAFSGVGQL